MIIRVEKNREFTTISNHALNDPQLSLKAKGLWAFIMTKPDNWKVNYRGLATQLKEGKDSILSAMKELESLGYLQRGQVRNDDGSFKQGDNILYEKPCAGNPSAVNPSTKVITDKVKTELIPDADKSAYSSKNKPYSTQAIQLLSVVNEVTGRAFRTLPSRGVKKTLDAFSIDEIKGALKTLVKDDWHKPKIKELSIDYLIRATTIDKFLAKAPDDKVKAEKEQWERYCEADAEAFRNGTIDEFRAKYTRYDF